MQILHSQTTLPQKDSDSLIQGVEKLVNPSDMGDKFKFMAITCPSVKPLTGFS
jgi:SAM-dependent MidA family methyltransferase